MFNTNLKNATNQGFYGPAIFKFCQDICYAPFYSGFWDTLHIIFWVFVAFLWKNFICKSTPKICNNFAYFQHFFRYVVDEGMLNRYVNFENQLNETKSTNSCTVLIFPGNLDLCNIFFFEKKYLTCFNMLTDIPKFW